MLITIKSKSFLGLKYDILSDQKIGKIKIPFTRLLGSSQFGDIGIVLQSKLYHIKVPLKGNRRAGFGVSGYKLFCDGDQISEVSFPPRGSLEKLTIKWSDNQITSELVQGQHLLFMNDSKMGTCWDKGGFRKTAYIDATEEIPIIVKVFWYLSYSYYMVISF